MKSNSVGFQGERGSYSEEAVGKYFKQKSAGVSYRTLYDLFQALENREIEEALAPIENSLEGSVTEAYDLLLGSTIKVTGEMNLRIVHSLIGHRDVRKEEIQTVYSHPQALAQCRRYLRVLGAETIATYDTAGSVKMVKERNENDSAAIASRAAANVYDMYVIDEGIEDEENNYTRFLLLSRNETEPSGADKTSIIFSASHSPGSLYRALETFSSRGINLTKIESRPTRQNPWEYFFFVDFEGHKDDEDSKKALEAISKITDFFKILGSYPRAREKA
jgi:prephenate dehydratase